MDVLLFIGAIALLTLGHYGKALRWRLFLSTYEEIGPTPLMQALSVGYLINFYLPLHLGDLVRAFLAGRRMENGFSFSLASVVLDRCLDVAAMAVIFSSMAVLVPSSASWDAALVYLFFTVALLVLLAGALLARRPLKAAARRVCSLFNTGIELRLLLFFWSLITFFRDVLRQVRKGVLLLQTVLIWAAYLSSYWLLAAFLQRQGLNLRLSDIILMLFHHDNLSRSTASLAPGLTVEIEALLALYILIPLGLLLLFSLLPRRLRAARSAPAKAPLPTVRLLPQIRPEDRLAFLQSYFDNRSREYWADYLAINRDLTIIRDYSAGSDATTMLCVSGNQTVFRKYAFGAPAERLEEQIDWIRQQAPVLPLPVIVQEQRTRNSCFYDMAYVPSSVGFFQYIHSHPVEQSWTLLEQVLLRLEERLYVLHRRPATSDEIHAYLQQKVQENLALLSQNRTLSRLLSYDTLLINGVPHRNLPQLRELLRPERLEQIFSTDQVSVIHGDLTVENIVCDEQDPSRWYLIDPNTGNLLDSPFLDYGKLLQSLHGKYEFFSQVPFAQVQGNSIDFLLSYTENYAALFRRYQDWLARRFSPVQLRSIYYHELVHWLRLLPHQLRKAESRAPLYYAGFLLIAEDIFRWFDDEPHKGGQL